MNRLVSISIILLLMVIFLPGIGDAAQYRLTILQGDNQTVQVGRPAPVQLQVKVTDASGRPMHVKLSFKVSQGSGSVEPATITSDAAGCARVKFIGGYSAGKTVVVASVADSPAASVQFNLKLTFDNPVKSTTKQPEKTASPVASKTSTGPVKPVTTSSTPKPSFTKSPAIAMTPVKPVSTPTKPVITPVKPVATPAHPVHKPPVLHRKAAVIIGFGGDNMQVAPGTVSSKSIEVQVMDDQGNPMSGVKVNFSIIEGDGKPVDEAVATDAKGIASTKVRAGMKKGPISVQASVAGGSTDLTTVIYAMVSDQSSSSRVPTPSTTQTPVAVHTPVVVRTPVTVKITPTPAATEKPAIDTTLLTPPDNTTRPRGFYSRHPEHISIVGGNYQRADAGARFAQPLVIYVTDADGNPAEATVQFTVLSGDANLTNSQVHTDERGLASTFAVANTASPIRIVAEIMEKPGLATIVYANTDQPGAQGKSPNPVIKSTVSVNQPGFPASIAFYSLRSDNTDNIEKTQVLPLEVGVTDFRNQPIATAVRFTVVKGNIALLNPVVNTNGEGRGICYVDISKSMGIFTVEAQSLENPDLKAVFKSGPQILTAPAASGTDETVVTPSTPSTPVSPATSDNNDTASPPVPATSSGKPALIAVLSGGGQKARVGTPLPDPIEIVVTDEKGQPVAGADLAFSVARGRARLSAVKTKTDAGGKATLSLTLGNRAGTVEVVIRTRQNRSLKTSFEVTAVN